MQRMSVIRESSERFGMGLVIVIMMLLAAFFLLRSEWEKLQLKAEFYTVQTKKKIKAHKMSDGAGKVNGTANADVIRLAFVSDLHEYLPAKHGAGELLAAIDSAGPDAVILGGDMITVDKRKKTPFPETETALSLIGKIASKYPVYYGEGNHESRLRKRNPEAYAGYIGGLISAGVRYLNDLETSLATDGQPEDTGITVWGISLEEDFYRPSPGFGPGPPMPEDYLTKKTAGLDRKRFNILLLHSPRYLKEAAGIGADLVLSGHMHGGTVRLHNGAGLMTPQYQLLVHECSGEFTEGDTRMIVNRGLGTHSIKIRFNDLPELSVVDIIRKNKADG